jgi:c-di-GMP-binding flagellar brake protein YcgR
MRAHVVDISATGALLATEALPPIGMTALLKSGLGAATFACEVQVRRTGTASGAPAVGVSFSAIDDRNRRNLDQFLKKAST